MLIDIPTMFVVLIALSATLSVSIGWVAAHEDQGGLRPLIVALALHALAYTLYALRGRIPDALSILVANLAVTGGYALVALAVAGFQRRRLSPLLLWSPVALFAVALCVFYSDFAARVAASSAVYFVQDLMLLWLLVGGMRRTVGRGQHLIIVGVAINLVIMVYRAWIAIVSEHFVARLSDPGTSQTLVYLSAFVSLNLVAIGFVLMTKEAADEKTRQMAMTDKLTGCWNRFRVEECAQQEMLRRQRYAAPVSLIVIDIDHFKPINDQYGHVAGDRVLQRFALTVQAGLRATDTLGRWGGEEFVVVMPETPLAAAVDTAERIRRAVEACDCGDGLRVTACFGVAACLPGDSWERWLQRADAALYQAKAQGRNRVVGDPASAASLPGRADGGHVRLVWRNEYASGNRTIDHEHRLLFAQGNQLLDAVLAGAESPVIAALISDVVELTRAHMAHEEEALAAIAYPGLAAHRAQHDELLTRAQRLIERCADDEPGVGEVINFIVFDLTAHHMLVDDRAYVSHLARS